MLSWHKSFFLRLVFAILSIPLLSWGHRASVPYATTVQDQHLIKPASVESEISFRTKDGWLIHGTLTFPKAHTGQKVPGAILVPGAEHDQSVFDTYPGWAKIQESIATLRFDLRGRGKSARPLESHSFTSEQRELVYLDVKAALELLEGQPNIDPARIGIVAEESGAEPAVLGAAGDPHVKVMIFLSGRLGEKAKNYIEANKGIAVLAVVSKEDQPSFGDMTDVYRRSKNQTSDILVFDDLGIGAAMGSVWRDKFPNQKPIDFTLGEWLVSRLTELGNRREVSFSSPDGYTLHADLVLPVGASAERKAPGALLLHSALGDRQIFESLSQSLARSGIAVLNLDWRGRGQSTEKGYYFELPKADRENLPLDVRAGVDFLALQQEIDRNNIGIVGLVLSARYGMIAAATDARVKTFVVLTGFLPGDADRDTINNLKVPVLYLLSGGRPQVTKAMMEHYALTKRYGSQIFSYSGSEHGFHLLETDKSLEMLIVHWLTNQLIHDLPGKTVSTQ
jgi:dienelactone hydrolase